MSELLDNITTSVQTSKDTVVTQTVEFLTSRGYSIFELNDQKPWGAYIRLEGTDADRFIAEFFPGLSPEEARLGMPNAELSPKILIVTPKQRLSWQYHNRRAERWTFLTKGAYNKSQTDNEDEVQLAQPGEVVQFETGERHRLVGVEDMYVVVAEIWQHTNKEDPSDEDDIIRLQDDYSR